RCIQYGDADVMVAGGAEMAFTPLGLGSFAQAKALSLRNDEPERATRPPGLGWSARATARSLRNDEPERASRPWDRDRDGFVMAEGAGAVVLEEYEHAKARGAKIYAEFVGFGMSAESHHITRP